MAVSLIGEIVNSCDGTGGFNVGNISGDDDFVEGTGAIGVKASATTQPMFTTTLGAGAPYDFSDPTGPEAGFHIIMWFNTKTPVAATGGLRIYVGDSVAADNGHWHVDPRGFYKGGFIVEVVDTARDFDVVTGFVAASNPGQLTNIDEVGGVFDTTTTIMGSFNNVQLDQITIGEGIRVDGGSVTVPNTFETVRAADEDTNFWGWWLSSGGFIVGRGKMRIGPATGSAVSVFDDIGFKVEFADARVAVGHYEIQMRGAGTDVAWELGSISAANSTNARWSLTVDSDTNNFDDINSVLSGYDTITLRSFVSFTGTVLIDGSLLTQNGATLSGISVLDADVVSGEWAIEADDLSDITDSVFQSNGVGHAIRYRPTGAGPFNVNYDGNQDSSYATVDGSTGNETILIDPVTASADITINVIGGASTPSIMEAAGYTGTFNLVINPVSLTVTAVDELGSVVEGASVLVRPLDNTDVLPFEESVTMTRSGTTAIVTHTAHGIADGKKVEIRGVDQDQFNGIFTISVSNVNEYTYEVEGGIPPSPTGSPISTAIIIEGVTNVSGQITDTRSYSGNQDINGVVRQGTVSPVYVPAPVTGTILSASGLAATVTMVSDE